MTSANRAPVATEPNLFVDDIFDWNPFNRVKDISCRMVGWQSETGTAGESAFSGHLAELLREMPYFRENPDDIVLIDSHGDPMTRNVVAIVRGSGPEALALAGHFDTAAVSNYHDLAHLACQPELLTDALLADLTTRALSEQEARALADLQTGDFLPGRAMLDMKSGLAAGLAVVERFAANPHRRGNLIFMATPDEERESRGMRSLRNALPELMAQRGLTIVGGLNLDATSDQGDGALGRAVYEGTIGKLLPFAMVIGQSSHASYPFEGVSAQLIGAEILLGIEGNSALADTAAAEPVPPPICLEARDLREGYEVTTPERFWIAFNWLYHSCSASDLFDRFRAEVEAALTRATSKFAAHAATFGSWIGGRPGATSAPARVLTLDELRAEAFRAGGEHARAEYAALEAGLSALDNPLLLSRRLTEALVGMAHLGGPAVVIGFAGLHYAPSKLDPTRAADTKLCRAVEAARAVFAADPGNAIRWRPIFHGISDMSFFGQPGQAAASDIVAANTPATRLIDRAITTALDFPVVNIGPWGREFHQRLERVYEPYAFSTLPRFLALIADHLLSGPQQRSDAD